eukprot:CAMPEP_0118842442 /NCGR_PEP_ID=MMETSP1162-20130426/79384_1 /TAXON_ID=33656 /ORGANISM="Phaeocystis Sp, Strain CCMP2710" /LENGTH=74 /DNA_ID=CAMNT_0006774505 /DNA_START=124 /DNA_END=346 /DNA_ORIENTATION=+
MLAGVARASSCLTSLLSGGRAAGMWSGYGQGGAWGGHVEGSDCTYMGKKGYMGDEAHRGRVTVSAAAGVSATGW